MKKNEEKVLKIVEKKDGLYTTQIAELFDYEDYKTGHQNKTYKILRKKLEPKGLVYSLQKAATDSGQLNLSNMAEERCIKPAN